MTEFERSIKGLEPQEFVTEANVDEAIKTWLPTRKEKSPIKDEYLPVLKRLMIEIIIPSMDRDRHIREEERILGNRITDERKLYEEITEVLPGRVRGVFYRTAKSISVRLVDSIMEAHRNDKFREHPGYVKGDPVATDKTRGASGVGGRSSYDMDPDMNPNGYARGIGDQSI